MNRPVCLLLALALPLVACTEPAPQANPEFNDAAKFAFVEFDDVEPANLAFAVRALERELYLAVDVEADATDERALSPEPLTFDDVDDLGQIPDVYPDGFDNSVAGSDVLPENTFPIAVAKVSAYDPLDHTGYQLLADQTPVEPSSPDHYDRTFLDGTETCYAGMGCEFLLTDNYLTKDNPLLTITYTLLKQYRWVDLNLPDPASVAEGEPIVNEGEPRWAIIGRSWDPEIAVGESGNAAIFQSYSIEIWVPRDGGGFVRDGSEANADGGAWTADSSGGGSLRLLALWSETSFGDADVIVNTTRNGIDGIFDVQESWLDEI